MDDYNPKRVLAVACPSCGARQGEQCLTASGRKRRMDDFHATRKGIVFPSFATKRRGLSDPRRKANDIMEKLELYLEAKLQLAKNDSEGAFSMFIQTRMALRDALQEALR